MARRDGMPTNSELLGELQGLGHYIFTGAAAVVMASDEFGPAFEGKPLPSLEVTFRRYAGQVALDGAVHAEELTIRPMGAQDAEAMLNAPRFWKIPDSDKEGCRNLGRTFDSTLWSSERGLVLPTSAMRVEYTAWQCKRGSSTLRPSSVATDTERPAKQMIVAAKFFAGEVAKVAEYRAAWCLPRGEWLPRKDATVGVVFGGLGIVARLGLPLNGHEPKEFLNGFLGEMNRRIEGTQSSIVELQKEALRLQRKKKPTTKDQLRLNEFIPKWLAEDASLLEEYAEEVVRIQGVIDDQN